MSIISIVHEYKILYSARVTQKHKKWQDGRLRYYEFNNKLEIYDINWNLVETDFFHKQSQEVILHKVLELDNEFILPNANYIITIEENVSVIGKEISFLKKMEKEKEKRRRPRSFCDDGKLPNKRVKRKLVYERERQIVEIVSDTPSFPIKQEDMGKNSGKGGNENLHGEKLHQVEKRNESRRPK